MGPVGRLYGPVAGGKALRGPRRPRRLQADDPVLAIAEPRRQRQALAPAARHPAALALLAGGDPLAPAVHRLAQRLSHLHPIANVRRVEQPALDQRMQVVIVEPDGNELLRLLRGHNPAAKGLGELQRGWLAGGAPIHREPRLLAAVQRCAQPADLATQGHELSSHPRQQILCERARRQPRGVSLGAARTGFLRQDRLPPSCRCAACSRCVVANQNIQWPRQRR